MKMRHVLVAVLSVWFLAAGCAQPPADQINAAEQAVKDAQQSGAATYAANDHAKVEGLLAAMKQEVADQDAKFALLRDYGKAEQLAATTKAEAERVKADATKKMEEAKFAATQAQHGAEAAVQSTLELVSRAPAGKRSEEHTSELQSLAYLVCRLLLEKKKKTTKTIINTIHTFISFPSNISTTTSYPSITRRLNI